MTDDPSADHPVVLFDGVCNLCTGSVQFLIRRDPEGVFRFAPLQSEVGSELATECGIPADELETVVLIEGGTCYTKSDAALRAAAHIGGLYAVLPPFRFLPKRLRDVAYDFVAARRYRWFGKKDQCMMPTPDIRSRFLAGGPGDPPAEPTDGDGD